MNVELRAYVAGSLPEATACSCLGHPVVKGRPTHCELIGWLHTADCKLTRDAIAQREDAAGHDAQAAIGDPALPFGRVT